MRQFLQRNSELIITLLTIAFFAGISYKSFATEASVEEKLKVSEQRMEERLNRMESKIDQLLILRAEHGK